MEGLTQSALPPSTRLQGLQSVRFRHGRPRPQRLHAVSLRATPGTGEVHVKQEAALDAVVAEDVRAADRVRQRGPLPAQGALPAGGGQRAVTAGRARQRDAPGRQPGPPLLQVDERQEEDEELGKAVPEELPVHVLETDLPRALGLTEHGAHAQEALGQRGKAAALQENQEVHQLAELHESDRHAHALLGFRKRRQVAASEQVIASLLQPPPPDRAGGEPELLGFTRGLVPQSRGDVVFVLNVQNRLPHSGVSGVDGEAPQEEPQARLQLRLAAGQESWLEPVEALSELGPDQLLQGLVQLECIQLADSQHPVCARRTLH